jgi:hypothetical protein
MSKLWELEDYLQEQGVYVSGINGRVCHMDSYMTCMEFKKFDEAMAKAPFTREELLEAAWQMNYHSYLSPMANLTSNLIQAKLCPAYNPIRDMARDKEKVAA